MILVLADEPAGNLDGAMAVEVMEILKLSNQGNYGYGCNARCCYDAALSIPCSLSPEWSVDSIVVYHFKYLTTKKHPHEFSYQIHSTSSSTFHKIHLGKSLFEHGLCWCNWSIPNAFRCLCDYSSKP